MIVGVHGIAQQQGGRAQLIQQWRPALADGIEAASGRPPKGVDLDIAYYGRLFLNDASGGQKSSSNGSPTADVDEPLAADELDTVKAGLRDILGGEGTSTTEAPADKGVRGVPLPVQGLLRAIDAKFGASAGVLSLGVLRQVRRYLTDLAMKREIDDIVADTMAVGARTILGHSLGSVLVSEFVRQHPDHELDLVLTLGSPLGLRIVRSLLPAPGLPSELPSSVKRWVNVYDPRDPIACAGGLAELVIGATDDPVRNGWDDAHSVTRYLGKRATGQALLGADPSLGSR